MLVIDPAWGIVSARIRSGKPHARSYDAAGCEYRWYPPPEARHKRFACDVERLRGRPPALLRRRSRARGAKDFCLRWSAAEVLSKLSAVPVLVLFKRYRLRHPAAKHATAVRLNGGRFLLRSFWIARRRTAVTLGYAIGAST